MSQTPPRYVYFDARARGELPRLVAAFTGTKINDERVSFDQFLATKGGYPYGQIPILEVGGKIYAQKVAIASYLAAVGNKDLLGKNDLETLEINQSLFFTEDLLEMIVSALADRDMKNLGPKKLEDLIAEGMPKKLEFAEKMLKQNGPTYFVGNRMTIADLSAFDVLEHLVDLEGEKYLDNYPTLKAHFQNIAGMESIKNYRENGRTEKPMLTW